MQAERWQAIVGNIKDNFSVEDSGTEHVDEEGGIDIEYIVFHGPLGRMRLEFITKPLVVGKKTNYSNRIGSETQVIYQYSDTEKSSKMIAYKWDEPDETWVEMEGNMFN